MTFPTTEIIDDLRPIRRPARVLYLGTAFWLFSVVVHLGVLAMDDWQWSGPLSFRKPLVFSLSMGLLLATVGWVLDRLPDRPRLAGTLAWTFVISSSVEVGLITMQTWRGRASHFNVLEAGDALVFAAMGVTVGVMSLCLLGVLVWSIIERPADKLVRLAVIGGLALVTTGLGIGQWIVEVGNDYVALNEEIPDTVINGDAGVVKFPHAVAFHGIQVFILSAVMLNRGRYEALARHRLMRLVFWSYTGVLVFATSQAILGLAPASFSLWGVGLAFSLAGLVYGLARIVSGVTNSRQAMMPVP